MSDNITQQSEIQCISVTVTV